MHALYFSPEDVVALAGQYKTPSIAFTYNDPVIFAEYVIDIARIAVEEGIHPVAVTAGYVDKNARKDVFKYIRAANVDLKAFSERFYHKITFSHLQDILDTLEWIHNETDIHLEITTLLIPGENDSADEIRKMSAWICSKLSDTVPLHFTAFHPDYKMTNIHATPLSTLQRARTIAVQEGIKFCYAGNVHWQEGHTTFCPECSNELIVRDWHRIVKDKAVKGKCYNCGYKLPGLFL